MPSCPFTTAPPPEEGFLLHLLRHAQVVQVSPRRFIGQRDVPLDETGRTQADEAGRALANTPFSAAYCSPLSRCAATARAVLAAQQARPAPVPVELPGLREIALGSWEGLTVDEVRARFPGEYERRGDALPTYRTPGGESFEDVQARAVRALDVMARAEHHGHVLAVAHAGLIRCVLSALQGLDLDRLFEIPQDYCRENLLVWDGSSWSVASINQPPGR
ncbi:MAG: histidine phosphatase family protein [Desulfovibrionaceae bacterium]